MCGFFGRPAVNTPACACLLVADQDEDSRAKSMAEAQAYVARTLFFNRGRKKLEPSWKVIAIDSNTMFPLAPSSAEAHLSVSIRDCCRRARSFQVSVAGNCAVGVILLNSLEGNDQRYPQSLFPGETSRRFALSGAGRPWIDHDLNPENGRNRIASFWFVKISAQITAGDCLMC